MIFSDIKSIIMAMLYGRNILHRTADQQDLLKRTHRLRRRALGCVHVPLPSALCLRSGPCHIREHKGNPSCTSKCIVREQELLQKMKKHDPGFAGCKSRVDFKTSLPRTEL